MEVKPPGPVQEYPFAPVTVDAVRLKAEPEQTGPELEAVTLHIIAQLLEPLPPVWLKVIEPG